MPVERRTEGVGLALWWTRQRDRNYLRKRGGGRPLGPGTEGPRVEPVKPEGRRSSPSGGENRKERPFTRLERASSDSNRRILKTVRPVVWEGAGAQSPALDPIQDAAMFFLEVRFRLKMEILPVPDQRRPSRLPFQGGTTTVTSP